MDSEIEAQQDLVSGCRKDLQTLLKSYQLPVPSGDDSYPDPDTIEPDENVDPKIYGLRRHTYEQALDFFTQSRAMLREMTIKQKDSRELLADPKPTITIHKRAM